MNADQARKAEKRKLKRQRRKQRERSEFQGASVSDIAKAINQEYQVFRQHQNQIAQLFANVVRRQAALLRVAAGIPQPPSNRKKR